jgi:radical SAM-linked protein
MKVRVRIWFQKNGDVRFIGHRDLVRAFERALRRSGLELRMSEGFHPHAKLSFPLALGVGIEGVQEVMEVEFDEEIVADQLLGILRGECPPGVEITQVEVLPPGTKKAQVETIEYELPIPDDRHASVNAAIEQLWKQAECTVTRPGRKSPVDVRADLAALEITHGNLRIRQRITGTASVRPREILQILGIDDLEESGSWLTRTVVELANS